MAVAKKTVLIAHEVEFYPDVFDCTIRDFIEQRERLRLPTDEFRTCYICGRHLQKHRKPIVVNVSGIGNRFACDKCYTEHTSGGMNGEKTEL